MKLVLGVYDYPPHPYHYEFIDDTWVFSDIAPRNPKIEKIDAREIPYKDLEEIYASHLLEHIHDSQKTLKHWFDCLMPGGKLTINVPDIEWVLDNIMEIHAGMGSRSHFYVTTDKCMDIILGTRERVEDRHLSWFNMAKLRKQLKNAGFKNIRIERVYEAHLMGCLIAYATKPKVQ